MLIMVFAQASLLGGVFPIVCHWAIEADRSAGLRLSRVYLGNIIGSVAGTLLTGFILMDHLSISSITVLLSEIGIALAVALAAFASVRVVGRAAVVAIGVVAGLAVAGSAGPLFGQVYEALTYKSPPTANEQFVDVVENKSGVVTVNRQGVVFGGGAYDGIIAIDMIEDLNQLIRPFSLSLYHSDPQEVLMIGMGTGAWEQVIANHPAVKHLTIIEINPGYLPIVARYPAVASLLTNPKVSIVIDDGRRWLNRHPAARFDAVVANTTWNYRPNATNLLSAEYLRLLAQHLRPGGVALYNTTGSLRAQRTACQTFADGYRELNAMVVANHPLRLDRDRLRAVLADYRIDGHPVFDTTDPRYRARLDELIAQLALDKQPREPEKAVIEDCRSILARSQALSPITDDNMGEEWNFILQNDPMLDRMRRMLGL
jgi:spermidine synthase